MYVSSSSLIPIRTLIPPAGMNTVKSSLSSFSGADVGCNKQSTSKFLVRHLLPVAMWCLSHTHPLSSRAVYGKVKAGDDEEILLSGPLPPPNVTPLPTPAFFDSQFWRRFQLQRACSLHQNTSTCFLGHLIRLTHTAPPLPFHTGPVIEPQEFVARFIASQNGKSDPLGITGRLLAMSLVVWASSFGVDENGQSTDPLGDHIYQYQDHKVDIHDQFDTDASAKLRTERRTRTNEMVKEMLYLIDVHGILRKPSWDGVRIILMILPLAQGKRFHFPRFSLFVLRYSHNGGSLLSFLRQMFNQTWNDWYVFSIPFRTFLFFSPPVPRTAEADRRLCMFPTGDVRIDDQPYLRLDEYRCGLLR